MLSLSLGGNAMGLLLCAVVGHRLTALEYSQQRVEASLRTALVLTENETQKPRPAPATRRVSGQTKASEAPAQDQPDAGSASQTPDSGSDGNEQPKRETPQSPPDNRS